MFPLFRTIQTLIVTLMVTAVSRVQDSKHDERGEAVPWLIVLGAGIAIAYFAGDAVMAFAKNLVGQLGN